VSPCGRVLKPGEPLQKEDVTEMLGGPGFSEMKPEYFPVDTNRVERLLGPRDGELSSFLVMADVQIDDRGCRFSPWLTRSVDKGLKIETTVRGFIQDQADEFYFGFILKAMRLALDMNTNIDFVMNLGDAMQVGRASELAAFDEMVGKFLIAGQSSGWEACWTGTWLQTPIPLADGREASWLNLIGNHDLFILGNFSRKFPVSVPGDAVTSPYNLEPLLWRTPPFTNVCRGDRTNAFGNGTQARGYYSVDRPLPDGKKVRVIVLNTSESTLPDTLIPKLQRRALYPSLSGAQFDWLRSTLADAQADESVGLVLVFGHYPLMEVTVNRTGKRSDRNATYGQVAKLLGEFPKVNSYFCGHLHSGGPPIQHRFGNHVVVEHIVPSLQEFPKCFGLASVRKIPVSGEYAVGISYYNLEDLMDLDSMPRIEVREDTSPYDQQTRLLNWLKELNHTTTNTVERVRLLAACCYLSSIYDVQHDLRKDISLCINPKLASLLRADYSASQAFWLQLKSDPSWHKVQVALEAPQLALPVVEITADSPHALPLSSVRAERTPTRAPQRPY
jgi:3',5'-cyclic AMP phosphodiesterase CpdA